MKQSRGLLVVSYLQSPAGHTQENHLVNLAKQRPGLGSVMALSFQGSLLLLSTGGGLRSSNDAGEKKVITAFHWPAGGTPTNYMLNVCMGRVSDFICSSKGLRAPELLTGTAFCMVLLLSTVAAAVPCFLRLLSTFLLNIVTRRLPDPEMLLGPWSTNSQASCAPGCSLRQCEGGKWEPEESFNHYMHTMEYY